MLEHKDFIELEDKLYKTKERVEELLNYYTLFNGLSYGEDYIIDFICFLQNEIEMCKLVED